MKLVNRIYHAIPDGQIKRSFDQLSFITGVRPSVKQNGNKSHFPNSFTGGMCISADFELAWAFRFSKTEKNPKARAIQARKNFDKLIKYFDEYDIPITWATVGHLFLEGCSKGDHDWMHRIPYFENKNWIYKTGDWFDADPCKSWEKAKSWYAPDLIEQILKAKVKHEIGCHTFSHIDFTDKRCPSQVADDEIVACLEAAKPWGINRFKSMVFPGGYFGNIETLKKHGFTNYRKNLPERIGGIATDSHGLIVSHSTGMIGIKKNWSNQYRIKRWKYHMDVAIRTGTVINLWFHPSFDENTLNYVLPGVLKEAAKLRDKGKLFIGTMEEIASLKDQ